MLAHHPLLVLSGTLSSPAWLAKKRAPNYNPRVPNVQESPANISRSLRTEGSVPSASVGSFGSHQKLGAIKTGMECGPDADSPTRQHAERRMPAGGRLYHSRQELPSLR
jgi:hypothetical protein